MKVSLEFGQDGKWDFHIEPENEIERCALECLARRPEDQVVITITRLGTFYRKVEK